MRIPTIRGLIDRRILVNFRVDPQVLSEHLPRPFRPQLVNGYGVAGICLIRLKNIRPRFLPSFMGVSSENAAHRIAVTWDVAGERRTGVFIPRRDSSSLINQIGGGRIFPGTHHHASFESRENGDHFFVGMDSRDGSAHVRVDGRIAADLPGDSIFSSVANVSRFFESGSLGYSPRASQAEFDGLELRAFNWHVDPLAINHVESSYFDDRSVFPAGSVTFDNALLMRGIDHEWHGRETLSQHL
ncbi:MAG: DUF2071 domain-containing protein [Planctomycetota bacterium]|nr:DUF2071 domain-containing protein [Planctomycetota bacterium]